MLSPQLAARLAAIHESFVQGMLYILHSSTTVDVPVSELLVRHGVHTGRL